MALDVGRMGTWMWNLASGTVEWDTSMERVFGLEPGSFSGSFEDYQAMLHPDDRATVSESVQHALATKTEHHVEHRFVRADGGVRWMSGRGRVVVDDAGEVVAMVGVGIDITDRKDAEKRVECLARAGDVLGSSLDVNITLDQLARLVIEDLADWCTIDLIEPEGIRMVTVAHRDPAKVSYARALRERLGVDLESEHGVGAVIQTGLPQVMNEIGDDFLREVLSGYDELTPSDVEEFINLGLRASLTIPLMTATGEVIGALSMVSAERGRIFDDNDLELAMELARRAAIAVDNARLYSRAEHASATLQRSLLPPSLPKIPFADVAAFYLPAGVHDLIGGDFYDAFPLGQGRWGVMVGDVAGKGVDAAALTAASRWTLRTALSRDWSPAAAIEELNRALIEEGTGRFVTVVAAVLEESEGSVSLTYASGGHPAPIVRRAGGTCQVLPIQGRFIGVLDQVLAKDQTIKLAPGDAVALFSDGFTEARNSEGFFGTEGMCEALGRASGESSQKIVDEVCAAVGAFGSQRDDMALLVLSVKE